MARVSEYTLIQNALVTKAMAGTFYAVTVDADHKFTLGATISPKTVLADEVSASFAKSHSGRVAKDDYANWTWNLHIEFDQKAVLHEFHYAMLETLILFASNTTTGVRQATAHLIAAPSIYHPTTKQSVSGTKVIYTLDVRLRPA